MWYKKLDLLKIPQCDHLHAVPYFSALERNIYGGKQCSFMTHRVKLFLITWSMAMLWPVVAARSLAPLQLLLVLVATGV